LLTISKERPVLIALARAGKNPTACGIFAHPASPWNTAYLLYDQLSRREIILHSAAIAVRQVAAYLANEESVPAIREIVFKIDVRDFIVWYESEGEERRARSAGRRLAPLLCCATSMMLVRWLASAASTARTSRSSGRCLFMASSRRPTSQWISCDTTGTVSRILVTFLRD
jgi:hypothetical protein